jgi:hypothetical protein
MQLITLLNCHGDPQLRSSIADLITKTKERYKCTIKTITVTQETVVPHFHKIRLFTFFFAHVRSLYGLRNIINTIHLKREIEAVLVLCLDNKSFPGSFSISRFCLECDYLIHFYKSNINNDLILCECQNGSVVNIYPNENYWDYFILS